MLNNSLNIRKHNDPEGKNICDREKESNLNALRSIRKSAPGLGLFGGGPWNTSFMVIRLWWHFDLELEQNAT